MFPICQTLLVQQIVLSRLLKPHAKIYLSMIPKFLLQKKNDSRNTSSLISCSMTHPDPPTFPWSGQTRLNPEYKRRQYPKLPGHRRQRLPQSISPLSVIKNYVWYVIPLFPCSRHQPRVPECTEYCSYQHGSAARGLQLKPSSPTY